MWELISANRKKSIILFTAMFFILLILGFFIGYYLIAEEQWYYGIIFAILLWAVLVGVTFLQGEEIILRLAQAKPANPIHYPLLHNVTEEMQIAANLPFSPDLFVIDDDSPNAFSTGKSPQSATIVVTTGVLELLNRNELQGVIAHEISHIINRDVLFMTHAAVMLGSIIFLSKIYLRGLIYSGGGRTRKRSMNRATGLLFILSIIFSLLAPLVANILYVSISKSREYLADASAVRLTRYPFGLMRALQKISGSTYEFKKANSTISSFYINDPFYEARPLFQLDTHPPIEKRIEILKSLTHDVNYFTYQKVYSRICGKPGKNSNIIPATSLKEDSVLSVIPPLKEHLQETIIPSSKPANHVVEAEKNVTAANIFQYILGVDVTKPDQLNQSYQKPIANNDKSARAIRKENGEVVYHRQKNGWESFACLCGSAKHLSPSYKKNELFCTNCSTMIKIVNPFKNEEVTQDKAVHG
jgi:heat shock protein HtpX